RRVAGPRRARVRAGAARRPHRRHAVERRGAAGAAAGGGRSPARPGEALHPRRRSRRPMTPPEAIEARRLHPMTLVQRLLVSIPALVVLLLPVFRAPDANAWLSL